MSLDIWWETPPCPACQHVSTTSDGHNITHNLNRLWRYIGCYSALYESAGRPVADVLPELVRSADTLAARTDEELSRFNAPNGWGLVRHARTFLAEVIASFQSAPDGAVVGVSR